MPPVPRIVVVDANYDIVRIVRGALALLSRQYILIEVLTSDDALQEVLSSNIDLVVTAYRIPGEMHGIELASRIIHETLGTPVIVLAEEGDPRLDQQSLREAPFQYFVRPVAEPFLRGLRIALDGEAAVMTEEIVVRPESDLGPVPKINVDSLRDIIVPLMRDVGAMGVILADRTGRVLLDQGATGYIDRETLAVILGPSFARSAEVSPLVGGDAWTMLYYDGERMDVFGLALGIHYFICLIFDGSNRGAFGAVRMFGRRAADQMIEIIGDTAYAVKRVEMLPPPRQEPVPVEEPEPRRKKKKPQEEIAAEAIEMEALFDVELAEPAEAALEFIPDLDIEALFGQTIDEGMADSLFDPDALGDLAEQLAANDDERVGYDEAIDMGILDE